MLCLFLAALWPLAARNPGADRESPLNRYLREARGSGEGGGARASAGSLYAAGSPLGDLARDLRASQIHDLVTVVVADRASAVAKGTTKSARQSSAGYSVKALAGPVRAAGPLAKLAGVEGGSDLQGQGTTSRELQLATTLSARVTEVLPNGYLVVEGAKETIVNSERQTVVVRGIARPSDLGPGNTIRSERLAQLEVRINGRGVVEDAIRRPSFLYRLLLGILPF